MKSPALRITIRKEILSLSSVIFIILVGILYILLSSLLLNYKLVLGTITGGFSFNSQIIILVALLQGIWTTMHIWDTLLFIINSLLVGINLLLIVKTIYYLEHTGKVKVSIGGAAVISLVTTGCASCGISIFSLLGLSSIFYFLPFHGLELHIAATLLLFFSAWYMIKKLHNAKYCKI